MGKIFSEFKRYYKDNKDKFPFWDFSEFVNDFMFNYRYYGEDIYYELMKLEE